MNHRRRILPLALLIALAALLAGPLPAAASDQQQAAVTATTTANLNMRSGPSTGYGVRTVIPSGTAVPVVGRAASANWLQVNYQGVTGWVAGWFVTVVGDVNSVPVVSAAPPAASVPIGASAYGRFELGGQAYGLTHADLMRSAGMTWVKYQQKWWPGQDPIVVKARIDEAHAQGFKVLFSVTGLSNPTGIDYDSYVGYLRGVALLGSDAIEVWNEPNYWVEWPDGQVSPELYVTHMLAPAYRAIKAINPNIMVVAAGPGPNGVNIPGTILPDDVFLAGMKAAGAAYYMDCVGMHYNAGATSPSATTGHPGDDGRGHHSWYFLPTLNVVTTTFPATPVCITEIGYLTADGYGWLSDRFSWASGTDLGEQAAWLGEAARLARASGRVRLMLVFNVDITHYSDDPQAGYAILRPDETCPACGPLAAALR